MQGVAKRRGNLCADRATQGFVSESLCLGSLHVACANAQLPDRLATESRAQPS